MANKILISDLIVRAIIGVHEYEKTTPQELSISLSFLIDIDHAAQHDALSDTHDYAVICHEINDFVERTPCQLLETLSKKLRDHLLSRFQLRNLQLTVTKRPFDLQANISVCLDA